MKVKKVEESNGVFEKDQKTKLKYFLNLCKYDVIPSAIVGSTASAMFSNIYSSEGVTGTALILAINGTITGIKTSKEEKEEIKQSIEENKEHKKGRQI